MPLIWTEQVYQQAYSRPYGLSWAMNCNYAPFLGNGNKLGQVGIPVNTSWKLLVVGCGFGFLLKVMDDMGYNPALVWGSDTSPFIQANKATQAPPGYASRILDLSIQGGPIPFQPYFGGTGQNRGKVHAVITEGVIESLLNDGEITAFKAQCENMLLAGGRVIHFFVSELVPEGTSPDPHDRTLGLNWQPREYYSARLSNHYLIDNHGWNARNGTGGGVEALIWNPTGQVWQ